jgi:uncharacterized protein (TIGR03435 family)
MCVVPALLRVCCLCIPVVVSAQSPHFDVAAVAVSPRMNWVKTWSNSPSGGYLSGDRYEFRRVTMLDLIGEAWDTATSRVYEGPNWIDYDRFEIVAKTKRGTPSDVLRLMLRTLLEDRFGLEVRIGTHPVPGYRLIRTKGEPKLKSSGEAGAEGCRTGNRIRYGGGERVAEGSITCRGATMDAVAFALAKVLSTPLVTPVVNATGIEGTWDLDLNYTEPSGDVEARNTVIADAVGRLGLAIEKAEIPEPSVTVVRVNELPTPDLEGTATALPPRPSPEFEVASLKLQSDGIGPSVPLRAELGGRVSAHAMPPATLVQQAWNLFSYQQVVGLPKSFLGDSVSANITIVAKAPEGLLPDIPAEANNRARDILYTMLRSLLIDRYKMKFHFEQRTVDGIVLAAAGRTKLTPADPSGRTGCRQDGQQQGRASLIVRVSCHNITMAEFAEQLQSFDPGITFPAQDATGLKGAWDFTFSYDTLARLVLPGTRSDQPPSGDGVGNASDPTGSMSLLEALPRQLGLKVATRKRSAQVLVIDSMLEKPVEN